MSKLKIKWVVQPQAVGRYRSFERRGWPVAEYADGTTAGSIRCVDDYVPRVVKNGNHEPLTLMVADHSQTPFKWMKATKQFTTLREAKAALTAILEKHPHLQKVQQS